MSNSTKQRLAELLELLKKWRRSPHQVDVRAGLESADMTKADLT